MNISGKWYAPVISKCSVKQSFYSEIQSRPWGSLAPAARQKLCLPSTGCAHAGGMSVHGETTAKLDRGEETTQLLRDFCQHWSSDMEIHQLITRGSVIQTGHSVQIPAVQKLQKYIYKHTEKRSWKDGYTPNHCR